MDKQPTPQMIAAYELGRSQQGKDITTMVYADEIPEAYLERGALATFWQAGYYGKEMPVWVVGERFGAIPASGVSYNYRDGYQEAGVSVVRLLDGSQETQDGVSLFFLRAGRPVVKVAGWLVQHRRGSDGEPLVVDAVEVA